MCTLWLLSSLSSQILKLEKPKPIDENPPVAKPRTGIQSKDPQQSHTELNSLTPEEKSQASSLSQAQVPSNSFSGAQSENNARRGSLMVSDNRLTSSARMRRYDSHSLLSENSLASSRMDLLDGVPYPE